MVVFEKKFNEIIQTFLGASNLVTDSRSLNCIAFRSCANQNTDTTLLQDEFVVVVGVPHGPAARVLFHVVGAALPVDVLTVTLWPELKRIGTHHLQGEPT